MDRSRSPSPSRSRSGSRSRSRSRSPQREQKRSQSTSPERRAKEWGKVSVQGERAEKEPLWIPTPKTLQEDLEGKTEEEIEMMKVMGFSAFDSTKGKRLDGCVNAYAVNISQKYREREEEKRREREREARERNDRRYRSRTPTRDRYRSSSMRHDRESYRRHHSSRDYGHSAEPHRPRLKL
ncbi:hypothetical protein QTO34_006526 [Cnephaeus nilssonii]|uniref:U4/U6.U5 small nuclear ribonucleoprotein 27 kDa protein n=1 Tax=Cnephaeus nilssonii TaxID=3371016 RepID=A0AA40HKP2_CNENI|nr:hypothetical protein QTO34_006526 [Eptesicus nilssonii]